MDQDIGRRIGCFFFSLDSPYTHGEGEIRKDWV